MTQCDEELFNLQQYQIVIYCLSSEIRFANYDMSTV